MNAPTTPFEKARHMPGAPWATDLRTVGYGALHEGSCRRMSGRGIARPGIGHRPGARACLVVSTSPGSFLAPSGGGGEEAECDAQLSQYWCSWLPRELPLSKSPAPCRAASSTLGANPWLMSR